MDIIQWNYYYIYSIIFNQSFFTNKGIKNISVEEVKNKFKDNNVQFIDVRTPGEYKGN